MVGSQAMELGPCAVVDVQVLVLRCGKPARAWGSARAGLGARLGPGLGLGEGRGLGLGQGRGSGWGLGLGLG